ncbi:MAG: EamA family transporter [Saprospiraceae bacterium]|nr:EamA family transporter [Saprospiraceae bacterium]
MSFFLIGPPALAYVFFTDFTTVMATHEHAWFSLGSVTILSLLGTVMASILFYNLVQKTSAVFGSTVTYLMPVVALMWGIAGWRTQYHAPYSRHGYHTHRSIYH